MSWGAVRSKTVILCLFVQCLVLHTFGVWCLVCGVVLGIFSRLANIVLRKSELVGFILYRAVAVYVM